MEIIGYTILGLIFYLILIAILKYGIYFVIYIIHAIVTCIKIIATNDKDHIYRDGVYETEIIVLNWLLLAAVICAVRHIVHIVYGAPAIIEYAAIVFVIYAAYMLVICRYKIMTEDRNRPYRDCRYDTEIFVFNILLLIAITGVVIHMVYTVHGTPVIIEYDIILAILFAAILFVLYIVDA